MSQAHQAIANRRTAKVLTDPQNPLPVTGSLTKERMDNWIEVAGNAPFHKPSHKNHLSEAKAFEPWRVVKLTDASCRDLMQGMVDDNIDAGKVMDMLASADGLALVTWTPNPPSRPLHAEEDFEATFDNMEHIAAASAFCQSMILAAEADDWRTYWSSGGVLRREPMFKHFNIPTDQVLIGALFFFPPEEKTKTSETKPGSLSKKRAAIDVWSRWSDG